MRGEVSSHRWERKMFHVISTRSTDENLWTIEADRSRNEVTCFWRSKDTEPEALGSIPSRTEAAYLNSVTFLLWCTDNTEYKHLLQNLPPRVPTSFQPSSRAQVVCCSCLTSLLMINKLNINKFKVIQPCSRLLWTL